MRDWKLACEEVCTDRLLQRCFMRALQRNADGDIDKDLIPNQIRAWYDGSTVATKKPLVPIVKADLCI